MNRQIFCNPTKRILPEKAKTYSRYGKVLIVVSCWIIIKTLISCNPPPPIDFIYNSIKIEGINNNREYIGNNITDTICAEALCLKLSLFDSVQYYAQSKFKANVPLFSFKRAMAMDYTDSYVPEIKLVSIKVVSIYNLNNEIEAGDDVTDIFLFTGERFSSFLYNYQEWAISGFNEAHSNPGSFIFMVLKVPVENSKAQFSIEVKLEDGSTLSDTTNTFQIITP